MKDLEVRLAQSKIDESKHLAEVYGHSNYLGWYRYDLKSGGDNEDIFVRFRLPPKIALYGEVIRNFTIEERTVGILRMPIGKDLKDQIETMMGNHKDEDIIANLSDDEVEGLLDRMKNMVTFDTNRIPYLHISSEESSETIDTHKEITKFLNYLTIYFILLYNFRYEISWSTNKKE